MWHLVAVWGRVNYCRQVKRREAELTEPLPEIVHSDPNSVNKEKISEIFLLSIFYKQRAKITEFSVGEEALLR
jgi:hypothetical protein